MRLVYAIAAGLACASGAVAQTAPDRYGPPRPSAHTPAAAYGGPVLSWSGKRQPMAKVAEAPAAPQPPEPMVLARQFVRAPALAAPPQAAAPSQPLRPAMGLPASLYDTARAAPAATRPAQAAPQPQQLAAAPQPSATPRPVGAPARLYSLHREYGMTPDAIPEPAAGPGYVLIGPSDAALASAPRDDQGRRDDDADDRPF